MARPTLTQTWVVQDDGTVDVLIHQGRNWRASITHTGLTDPTGYQARVGFKASYDDPDTELLISASTDDYIEMTVLPASTGTRIDIDIPDSVTETVTVPKGRWDLVIESPGGDEDTVVAGDFFTWRRVTP